MKPIELLSKFYLSEREAAVYLGASVAWMRKMRHQRKGPPWLKAEGLVRYSRPDLEVWIAGCRKGGTQNAAA